jgi:hypothetical protein
MYHEPFAMWSDEPGTKLIDSSACQEFGGEVNEYTSGASRSSEVNRVFTPVARHLQVTIGRVRNRSDQTCKQCHGDDAIDAVTKGDRRKVNSRSSAVRTLRAEEGGQLLLEGRTAHETLVLQNRRRADRDTWKVRAIHSSDYPHHSAGTSRR